MVARRSVHFAPIEEQGHLPSPPTGGHKGLPYGLFGLLRAFMASVDTYWATDLVLRTPPRSTNCATTIAVSVSVSIVAATALIMGETPKRSRENKLSGNVVEPRFTRSPGPNTCHPRYSPMS